MVYTARVCRYESPCTPRTLKEWGQCRIHHGELKTIQIAERAHIRHDLLLKYFSDSQTVDIPFTALVRLCRVLKDFSAFDLVLVPEGYRLTHVDGIPQKDVIAETLDVAASGGRVVAAVQAAVEDGVDVHEAARIYQQIADLRKQADELELVVRRTTGGVQ